MCGITGFCSKTWNKKEVILNKNGQDIRNDILRELDLQKLVSAT